MRAVVTRAILAADGARSPQSYGAKAAFARAKGLAGINMFDLTGDTADSALIRSAREKLLVLPSACPAPTP